MKRHALTYLFATLALMVQCQSKHQTAMINTGTVKNLSLEKFQGKWYEIARLPNSFENNLMGVTATYTLRANGKIKVLNEGYLNSPDGKHKTIKGKAKLPDPEQPGRLKVSFFLFFYSDYLILELDQENYQWAMIGSSSPNYFWILCREPKMTDDIYQLLLDKAKQRGYDLSPLQKVPQLNSE